MWLTREQTFLITAITETKKKVIFPSRKGNICKSTISSSNKTIKFD